MCDIPFLCNCRPSHALAINFCPKAWVKYGLMALPPCACHFVINPVSIDVFDVLEKNFGAEKAQQLIDGKPPYNKFFTYYLACDILQRQSRPYRRCRAQTHAPRVSPRGSSATAAERSKFIIESLQLLQ
jgi:hypothetical protein